MKAVCQVTVLVRAMCEGCQVTVLVRVMCEGCQVTVGTCYV